MKQKLMELGPLTLVSTRAGAGKLIDVKEDINLEQQAWSSPLWCLGGRFDAEASQCDALKTMPFFMDPSDSMHEFVAEIAMNTNTFWYKPGTVLVQEGDTNCDEMFILLRGSCEVYSCGQLLGRTAFVRPFKGFVSFEFHGKTMSNARIEQEVIGEIGLLDLLERRTATVKTATACQCMKLSRQAPLISRYDWTTYLI